MRVPHQMTTFVTFYQSCASATQERDDFYFKWFEELAISGVPILLFLGHSVGDRIPSLLAQFPNVTVQETIDGPEARDEDHLLPVTRDPRKDTAQYMMIMHEKLRYLAQVASFATTPHLAWIDFGIFKIFRDKDACREKLREIAACDASSVSCTRIYSPGHWPPVATLVSDRPCWRYLGGFLFGKKELFPRAYEVQQSLYEQHKPVLLWEVNYWALMDDVFEWYLANHDDTMILALSLTGQSFSQAPSQSLAALKDGSVPLDSDSQDRNIEESQTRPEEHFKKRV